MGDEGKERDREVETGGFSVLFSHFSHPAVSLTSRAAPSVPHLFGPGTGPGRVTSLATLGPPPPFGRGPRKSGEMSDPSTSPGSVSATSLRFGSLRSPSLRSVTEPCGAR